MGAKGSGDVGKGGNGRGWGLCRGYASVMKKLVGGCRGDG